MWTFAVNDVYKGRVRQTQAVYSFRDGASCGLEIPTSGTFFVFARWITADNAGPGYPIGELIGDLCGGTRSVETGPLGLDPPVEPVAPIADAPTTTTTIPRAATGAGAIAEPVTDGGNVLVIGFLAVGVIGAIFAARLAKKSRET